MKDYVIQSVLFNKNYFTINECYGCLKLHHFNTIKVHITNNWYRCRQRIPEELRKEGYGNYFMKKNH